MEKKKVFKDLSMMFKPHPLTGDLTTVVDARAINQSLRNLFLTSPYERPFDNIEFGVGIRDKLFDLMGIATQIELEEEIQIAIANWEPRVFVINIDVEANPQQHSIRIKIYYKIKTFQEVEEFEVFLERA